MLSHVKFKEKADQDKVNKCAKVLLKKMADTGKYEINDERPAVYIENIEKNEHIFSNKWEEYLFMKK